MLFVLTIVILFYFFINKKNLSERLAIMTIFYSVFFFSSKDPFIGIPLYFYIMLLSILTACLKKRSFNTYTKKSFLFVFLLLFEMLLQIINIKYNFNITPTLLINSSITDTINIKNELVYPEVNFTVIKHFIFFALYLFFVYFNINTFQSDFFSNNLLKTMKKGCHFIFIGSFIEFIVVNITNLNTVPIMEFIFSFQSNTYYNWDGFLNTTSVSFCLVERSAYMDIIIFYYLILLKEKFVLNCKNMTMLFLSLFCIFFSSSSSTLFAGIIFFCLWLIKSIFESGDIRVKLISLFTIFMTIIVVISNYNFLFSKIIDYYDGTVQWSSSFFRRQANNYGLEAFKFSPILGLGIGTNYSHSMLIQVLANIGILGLLLTLLFHLSLIKISFNIKNILIISLLIIIYTNSGLIQTFTSPSLLFCFLCIGNIRNTNKSILSNKQDYRLNSIFN